MFLKRLIFFPRPSYHLFYGYLMKVGTLKIIHWMILHHDSEHLPWFPSLRRGLASYEPNLQEN